MRRKWQLCGQKYYFDVKGGCRDWFKTTDKEENAICDQTLKQTSCSSRTTPSTTHVGWGQERRTDHDWTIGDRKNVTCMDEFQFHLFTLESGVNSMETWIHPSLYQQFRLMVTVGDIFFAHIRFFRTSWASFKSKSFQVLLVIMFFPLWPN